jgi:hypothetical protein
MEQHILCTFLQRRTRTEIPEEHEERKKEDEEGSWLLLAAVSASFTSEHDITSLQRKENFAQPKLTRKVPNGSLRTLAPTRKRWVL